MKLLFLYYDLMNLYGENGNMRILERHLKDQGQPVQVDCKTLGDEIDFSEYSFLYVGAGTERNQKKALAHLMQYRSAFLQAIESGMVALFTGNACEMLGSSIIDGDGQAFEGIGLLPFTSEETNEKRYTGDAVCVCTSKELLHPLVGFINKCSTIQNIDSPLFQMQLGFGNSNTTDKGEGFRVKNLFGTHLIGPVLSKNPEFTALLVQLLAKQEGFEITPKTYEYEEKAYQVTLQELQKRMQA